MKTRELRRSKNIKSSHHKTKIQGIDGIGTMQIGLIKYLNWHEGKTIQEKEKDIKIKPIEKEEGNETKMMKKTLNDKMK